MLSVTRYNPGRYPPGPRFPQFGDDALTNSVDEARQKLVERRKRFEPFHLDRLQAHHLMPYDRQTAPRTARDAPQAPDDTFDEPPPPPAPMRQMPPEPEPPEPEETAPTPVRGGLGSAFATGATSTVSNMGAALIHGGVVVAGTVAGSMAKGFVRGLTHLATGTNPLEVPDEAEEDMPDEPLRAYPQAKASPSPGYRGSSSGGASSSSGSNQRPPPVDVNPWNGGTINISDDEQPAPAAVAPARRPVGRQIAQRDVRFAEATYDPNLRRRRG